MKQNVGLKMWDTQLGLSKRVVVTIETTPDQNDTQFCKKTPDQNVRQAKHNSANDSLASVLFFVRSQLAGLNVWMPS